MTATLRYTASRNDVKEYKYDNVDTTATKDGMKDIKLGNLVVLIAEMLRDDFNSNQLKDDK